MQSKHGSGAGKGSGKGKGKGSGSKGGGRKEEPVISCYGNVGNWNDLTEGQKGKIFARYKATD